MHKRALLFVGIGIVLGAALGYVYYAQVGCVNGTCAIWAHPWRSTGYGALLGALVGLVADFKQTT